MFIHELRTPISTILMGIYLLEKNNYTNNSDNNSDNNDIINDMKESINFIEQIFTKFTIIKNGYFKLNTYEPFSLNILFINILDILKYNIKYANILFEYKIDSDVHDCNYGDKYNIKHCIINLIKNAIKYRELSHKTIITVQISKFIDHMDIISKIQKCQIIMIRITDNNNNLPYDIKKHLFEIFNSTSNSGLGLYICKNIIESHGGKIYHNYIEPNGNEFSIKLSLKICKNITIQDNISSDYNENTIIQDYIFR